MMMIGTHFGTPKQLEILIAVWMTSVQISLADHWGYTEPHGPSTWKENYPSCGGKRQSPINIESKGEFVHVHGINYKIMMDNYNKNPVSMKLINNGHSVQLKATHKPGETPTLQINSHVYLLDQIHFHWGRKGDEGSEHTINHKRYSLELHAVHRLVDNGSPGTPSELVVVAVLFQLSENKNPGLEHFVKYIGQVKGAGEEVEVHPFAISSVIPQLGSFYKYEGSLTTPPCSEVVSFIVKEALSRVSDSQMSLFREVFNDEGEEISGNFRPVQPLNGRKVYRVHNG